MRSGTTIIFGLSFSCWLASSVAALASAIEGDHEICPAMTFPIKLAVASPTSRGESSWRKWEPRTVTLCWFGQARPTLNRPIAPIDIQDLGRNISQWQQVLDKEVPFEDHVFKSSVDISGRFIATSPQWRLHQPPSITSVPTPEPDITRRARGSVSIPWLGAQRVHVLGVTRPHHGEHEASRLSSVYSVRPPSSSTTTVSPSSCSYSLSEPQRCRMLADASG